MSNLEEVRNTIHEFNREVSQYTKENVLTTLPEFYKLRDKDIFGKHYAKDQVLYEVLTGYKSNYYGLQAYLLKQLEQAQRHEKYAIEALIDLVNMKSKELDSKLEAAKSRLNFYKTTAYIVGNVLYGVE